MHYINGTCLILTNIAFYIKNKTISLLSLEKRDFLTGCRILGSQVFLLSSWLLPTSLIAQLVKNLPAMQETPSSIPGSAIPWRRDRPSTQVFLGFHYGLAGKESAHDAEDLDSIPGLGRSPGEGKGDPLQYSGLENSMDCRVHGVAKSLTLLSLTH